MNNSLRTSTSTPSHESWRQRHREDLNSLCSYHWQRWNPVTCKYPFPILNLWCSWQAADSNFSIGCSNLGYFLQVPSHRLWAVIIKFLTHQIPKVMSVASSQLLSAKLAVSTLMQVYAYPLYLSIEVKRSYRTGWRSDVMSCDKNTVRPALFYLVLPCSLCISSPSGLQAWETGTFDFQFIDIAAASDRRLDSKWRGSYSGILNWVIIIP
jgi:hypothetical protein